VALFAFLVQAATGILLSLNYAPSPGDAYDSLRHILMEVPSGRLLRALHHWGASLLIIVLVAHMVQTFVCGTYQKPREATWIAGVLLLLLTLAFGLSGSLLPWDNRAYWGTAAILRIFGVAPGAIDIARFHVAHVQILPPLTALLVLVHIYLARKHRERRSYRDRVVKDALAIFAWCAALIAMSVIARLPLGHLANPADQSYVTRPQWYFLFLFKGPLEAYGAAILLMAVVALIVIPFIDQGHMDTVRRRASAIGLVAMAAIFWAGLTARAIATTPETREMDMSLVKPWQEIPAGDLASVGYFRKAQCGGCHQLGKEGAGPQRPLDWLEAHIKSNAHGTLTDRQGQMLAAFVITRGDKAVDALRAAPQNMVEGALVYQENDCGSCHRLNGIGDELGPALNGVGERRERSWIEQHFADPPKHSPNSIMPSFQFKPNELKAITDYLVAIPK